MNNSLAVVVIASGVAYGTPLLYAALGELLAERSGVLNLGVEGMMLIGAVMGFWTVQRVHAGSGATLVAAIGIAAPASAATPIAAASERPPETCRRCTVQKPITAPTSIIPSTPRLRTPARSASSSPSAA